MTYEVVLGLPCVRLASTNPPQPTGSFVNLDTAPGCEQRFVDSVIVPLRIFLDLLHVHLTHNEDKYLHLYPDHEPVQPRDYAVRKLNWSSEIGCFHSVSTKNSEAVAARLLVPQHTVGNDNDQPKIPEVAPIHLSYTGLPSVTCTIARYPSGPLFLSIKGWSITLCPGRSVKMLDSPSSDDSENVFPLCHTEHLSGLVAAIHRWLHGDYRDAGLLVICAVYYKTVLVPEPARRLGYKYDLDRTLRIWPSTCNVRDMWTTTYDKEILRIQSTYGRADCRNAQIQCPGSEDYVRRKAEASEMERVLTEKEHAVIRDCDILLSPKPVHFERLDVEENANTSRFTIPQHTAGASVPVHSGTQTNVSAIRFIKSELPESKHIDSTARSATGAWRQITLGSPELGTGNSFYIRYSDIHGVPCVTFDSNHSAFQPGDHVMLTAETCTQQLFTKTATVPLRIFLDLLHMVLTHDKKCESLYDSTPCAKNPANIIRGLPESCADAGCGHEFVYNEPDDDADDDADDEDKDNDHDIEGIPNVSIEGIPKVSDVHLRFPGMTSTMFCSIAREPRGPVFLGCSGWDVIIGKDTKTIMAANDDPEGDELEHVFPLCHTEHLPGFVAAIHKWLQNDYRTLGLSVSCRVPHQIVLLPTPSESNEYYYTPTDVERCWPQLSGADQRRMWQTYYGSRLLPVEPVFGAFRVSMMACPYNKRHCRGNGKRANK